MSQTNKIKQALAEHMLQQGPLLVSFYLNGADVPESLDEGPTTLRFGYNLLPDIPDLLVAHNGIGGTLTFAGVPHTCWIPWENVIALVSEFDDAQMVWPHTEAPEAPESKPELEKKKPTLKLV